MFLGNVNSEADLKFGLATPEQAANQALMAAAEIQNQILLIVVNIIYTQLQNI